MPLESVANRALTRPHMIQISTRDETYLTLNSVMTLRHSRKRDKVYLKKLCFLRSFLSVLQLYRAYLSWNFRNHPLRAIDGPRQAVKPWQRLKWRSSLYRCHIDTTVIFRYHKCQLTVTSLIKLPHLFSFDMSPIDNIPLVIRWESETLRNSPTLVCRREEPEPNDSFCCDGALSISCLAETNWCSL